MASSHRDYFQNLCSDVIQIAFLGSGWLLSWRLVAVLGDFWWFLARPGAFWRLLAFWRFLAHHDSWAAPGVSWWLLAARGGSWWLLGGSGGS